MTDDVLARARQVLDGVTGGPWRVGNDSYHDIYSDDAREFVFQHDPGPRREDAEFIAAARTLVPELADALETARYENERQLGEFVAQHQREYAVLGGFDCCTCGWTAFDGSGCATYEEHVEAAWLAARTA